LAFVVLWRNTPPNRVVFMLACGLLMFALGAWTSSGPPTIEEIIRANEGD
jgi:hypothetical protein